MSANCDQSKYSMIEMNEYASLKTADCCAESSSRRAYESVVPVVERSVENLTGSASSRELVMPQVKSGCKTLGGDNEQRRRSPL